MQYLLLIYDDEQVWASMPEQERSRYYDEYRAYTTELQEKGVFVGGAQLQPTATATTVHVRDGEQIVTDGPFADTKEQLGGYYVIEAESVDDALEWAARIPSARLGRIEVRPLVPSRVEAPAG
jgi:hypothetical protein